MKPTSRATIRLILAGYNVRYTNLTRYSSKKRKEGEKRGWKGHEIRSSERMLLSHTPHNSPNHEWLMNTCYLQGREFPKWHADGSLIQGMCIPIVAKVAHHFHIQANKGKCIYDLCPQYLLSFDRSKVTNHWSHRPGNQQAVPQHLSMLDYRIQQRENAWIQTSLGKNCHMAGRRARSLALSDTIYNRVKSFSFSPKVPHLP